VSDIESQTTESGDQIGSCWQTGFPAGEFAARREKISAIGSEAHALLQSAPAPRGYVVFRQTNEFFYCCGFETPQAYPLMNRVERRSTLYLPGRGKAQLGEGTPPGVEDVELVKALTGVDKVCDRGRLSEHLAEAQVVYTPHAPVERRAATRDGSQWADQMIARDPWDGQASRELRFIALLRSRLPKIEVRDLTPVLDGR
jgi:Xaa-Pro aminopeptidase